MAAISSLKLAPELCHLPDAIPTLSLVSQLFCVWTTAGSEERVVAISSLEPPATAYSPAEEALLRCCAAALAWDTADEEDKPELQVLRLLVTSNQVGWQARWWTLAVTSCSRGCKPALAAVWSVHAIAHMEV